jgi:hypothetical protein
MHAPKIKPNNANTQRQTTLHQAGGGGDSYQLQVTKSAREVSDSGQLLKKADGQQSKEKLEQNSQTTSLQNSNKMPPRNQAFSQKPLKGANISNV